jgi:hypothetical protein
MRTFAPHRLGRYECDAWVSYYRREWTRFFPASYGMVREGFGMSQRRTLSAASIVLRANKQWAPYPDNDRAGAESSMRQFYDLVRHEHGLALDPAEAARLEVGWWHEHRELQHLPAGVERDSGPLVDALTALYAYVYDAPADELRPAAQLRADAMDYSDRWVADGCDLGSPLLVEELVSLVRSYGALRAAVQPQPAE